MNVLFVTNAYHPAVGGVERVAARLASDLKKLQCNVEIVTAWNPPGLRFHETIDGISVHRLPFYVYRDSLKSAVAMLLGMPVACAMLAAMALRRRPCIVHVHFPYHNAVCVELIRGPLQRLSIPVVVTFHGGDAPNIPISYAQDNPSESRILNWAAMRLLEGADALTAVSDPLKQEILPKMRDKENRFHVILNGVDIELFSPDWDRPERKAILTFGRLSYQKGFDILFHSFSQLAAEFPDWELRVAGDGELRGSLEELVNKLKMQDRIRFLGMLSTKDLIDEIRASAFIACASRWEGFCLATLEGLSCGKPVVMTDVGGARVMIVDGVNGRIVPKEEPYALTEAMKSLLSQPAARKAMGRQARSIVERDHTWEKVVLEYKSLYLKLMMRA